MGSRTLWIMAWFPPNKNSSNPNEIVRNVCFQAKPLNFWVFELQNANFCTGVHLMKITTVCMSCSLIWSWFLPLLNSSVKYFWSFCRDSYYQRKQTKCFKIFGSSLYASANSTGLFQISKMIEQWFCKSWYRWYNIPKLSAAQLTTYPEERL